MLRVVVVVVVTTTTLDPPIEATEKLTARSSRAGKKELLFRPSAATPQNFLSFILGRATSIQTPAVLTYSVTLLLLFISSQLENGKK